MPKVTVSERSDHPRVIAPNYAYNPNGIYADPHVQAWATYYANGSSYKTPVGETVPSALSTPVAPPSPKDLAGITVLSDHARPHGPRIFQSRPKQRSKGLPGLLEFLHITRKPRPTFVTPWVANTGSSINGSTRPSIDPSGSDQTKNIQEKASQTVHSTKHSFWLDEKEIQDLSPSYAESVFNLPTTYPSGKVSFSPYVHFGSDGTGSLGHASQRPLPFPRSASAYSDAEYTDLKSSPKVEPKEIYLDVGDATDAPFEAVSDSLSMIEETLYLSLQIDQYI
ncbi:hypothetical protein DFS33DRAFT_1454844, partial [Desarmillaria ectypa]